jgi:hypothetical protein
MVTKAPDCESAQLFSAGKCRRSAISASMSASGMRPGDGRLALIFLDQSGAAFADQQWLSVNR